MKRRLLAIVLFATLALPCPEGYAYDLKAHDILAEKAAKASVLRDTTFLSDLLGSDYAQGIRKSITYNGKTQRIEKWIREGAQREDDPSTRCLNHFHDPNKPWDAAGLSDLGSGDSSVRWAQNFLQDPSTIEGRSDLGGDWALYDFRQYLLKALKPVGSEGSAASSADVEANLAQAFMALGHLIHLVQDAAVPAHVRNDAHPIDGIGQGGYETWIGDHIDDIATDSPQYLVPLMATVDLGVASGDPSCFSPIARLWDTTTEAGAIAPSVATNIGLADYTNVNFLSRDTMFTEDFPSTHVHYQPHPAENEVEIWQVLYCPPDWVRQYYKKKPGIGEQIAHLACPVYSDQDMQPRGTWQPPGGLDSNCYNDYAANLLPRAVGYSTALINYLFRGTLKILPPAQYLYALVDLDAPNAAREITQVTLRLKNTSPDDEEMTGGTLVCVARYRKPVDNSIQYPNYHDVSHEDTIVHYPLITTAEVPVDYSYSVSDPIEISSQLAGSGSERPTVEFTFTFPTEDTQGHNQAIPGNIFDLDLQVIFKGTLGQEEHAVAVGRADVCEPMQIVLWNDMDWFGFLDEPLRTDPNGDLDHDGQAEYFFCRSSSETVSLTFFDPAIAGGEPDPQIDFPVQPGTCKKYLLVQPSSTGQVRYQKTTAVGPILPSDNYLSEFPLLNQFFLSETEVLDAFGQDGSRYQNFVFSTNPGRHRGTLFHNLFGAGTYDHYASDRVLEGDSLRVLHTEEWDLGGSRHALARAGAEPPIPGASGGAIPRLKLSEKPTKERRSSY